MAERIIALFEMQAGGGGGGGGGVSKAKQRYERWEQAHAGLATSLPSMSFATCLHPGSKSANS